MQQIPTSVNIAIFVIFFGGSVLDAFATRNWWRAAFWMIIAVVFLAADRMGRGASRVR
jgi:hypothetical protein